jgi:hypothetical protein
MGGQIYKKRERRPVFPGFCSISKLFCKNRGIILYRNWIDAYGLVLLTIGKSPALGDYGSPRVYYQVRCIKCHKALSIYKSNYIHIQLSHTTDNVTDNGEVICGVFFPLHHS